MYLTPNGVQVILFVTTIKSPGEALPVDLLIKHVVNPFRLHRYRPTGRKILTSFSNIGLLALGKVHRCKRILKVEMSLPSRQKALKMRKIYSL